MLKVENMEFRYSKRSAPVLKGVDLELGKGEIGILLGKNGSGKTTLFKCILGICRPDRGSALFDGKDLIKMSGAERARVAAYVPQDVRFGDLSVFDSVLMGRISTFGIRPGREDAEKTEAVLRDMGMEGLAAKSVSRLSGGERRKAAIARALVQEPELIVFDEPAGNLDIANEQLISGEIEKLAREKGISVLCSLHDLNMASALGDRFFLMKDGTVKYSGGRDILTEEAIRDVYGGDVRIIEHEGERIILGRREK